MLVVACNTATAVALNDIRALFSFPIIGVINPGARAAVNASKTGKIAVLGTIGTINSGSYDTAIKKLIPEATVYPLACPEFVLIVESGQYKSENADEVVKKSLEPIIELDFDAAILGCTHYPLLEDKIGKHLSKSVKIISSAIETVRDVEETLLVTGVRNLTEDTAEPVFYTTGSIDGFQNIVMDWLDIKEPDVRHIELELTQNVDF